MIFDRLARKVRRSVAAYRWKRQHLKYLVVFNYHQVSPVFHPGFHARVTWTPLGQFNRAISFLLENFTVLDLAKGLELLCRRELPGPCAAITFDDGDPSVPEHCIPLLEKHSIPATFFINSACYYGHGHYWFTVLTYLQNRPGRSAGPLASDEIDRMNRELRTTMDPARYLELEQQVERLRATEDIPPRPCVRLEWLRSLDGKLFTLGVHGHDHQRYSMKTGDWQRTDLNRNVAFLKQFRAFRPLFAFPFGRKGDYNENTLVIAAENGLRVVAADGGINVAPGPIALRIPSDGQWLPGLFRNAMLA